MFFAERCRQAWHEPRYPQWPELTRGRGAARLTAAVDAKSEAPRRLHRATGTSISNEPDPFLTQSLQRTNRVCEPCRRLAYLPGLLNIAVDDADISRHTLGFDRYPTFYDRRRYVNPVTLKPGAWRNGAPLLTMPLPMLRLQA